MAIAAFGRVTRAYLSQKDQLSVIPERVDAVTRVC